MIFAAELAQVTDDERHQPAVMLRGRPVSLLGACSAACAAFLLVWVVFLGATLPAQAVAHEWKLAWVGLDVAGAAGLLVVTWGPGGRGRCSAR